MKEKRFIRSERVAYSDRKEMPCCPGVYVATVDEKPVYVGMSKSLRGRWHYHTHAAAIKEAISSGSSVHIYFWRLPESRIAHTEMRILARGYFPWNSTGREPVIAACGRKVGVQYECDEVEAMREHEKSCLDCQQWYQARSRTFGIEGRIIDLLERLKADNALPEHAGRVDRFNCFEVLNLVAPVLAERLKRSVDEAEAEFDRQEALSQERRTESMRVAREEMIPTIERITMIVNATETH